MRMLSIFLTLMVLIAGLLSCAQPIAEDLVQYNLTVSSSGGGSVSTPGEDTYTYDYGTVVDLVATPDTGYQFINWTGDVGTIADVDDASTTITMNGDYSITANFQLIPLVRYSLIISSTDGGSVTTPGEGTFTYEEGTVVRLVATRLTGYQFVNWTGDVDTISDVEAASTTIIMRGDYSITAGFELKPTGAFLTEILITREPSPATAVQRLKEDALDVYALGLDNPARYAEVLSDPSLTSAETLTQHIELTFNPVGPVFPETGKLNPFSVPEFRQAMHWLIDREYIAGEIWDGLAMPRFTCLDPQGTDATHRFPDIIASLSTEYDHNPTRAATVIGEQMTALGAELVGGKWHYNGEQVELTGLIRTEDERKETGDYFADLLDGLGFSVTRQYGTMPDLEPFWRYGEPAQGLWHFYTGGWLRSRIPRDDRWSFGALYTNLWSVMGPLWQAYVNDPVFYEAAKKLWDHDYSTMEERTELFEICLSKSMEDNVRMFISTGKRFSPMRNDVRVAADAVAGLSGAISIDRHAGADTTWAGYPSSLMWALTAHFVDDEAKPIVGGTLRVAMPDVLTNPWNPIAGSGVAYDTFAIVATGDMGLQPDTRTGLHWPGRLEKAEIFVQTGVLTTVTNTEWCSLDVVPEIQVPLDAWADWDAKIHEFITVQQKFGTEGTIARSKSVAYYPKYIFDVPLHDGSTLSMGDFILHTILRFDRAKPDSAIYDESAAAAYNDFMSTFKGAKFIIDDPEYGLIVEYYSDKWELDAELMVTPMFPIHSQGPGFWHTVALGIRAEEDQALAFSGHKAGTLGVAWMNLVDGPSLPILESYLTSAKATGYIPYEPTMSLYVSQTEVAKRWSNLEEWYADKGHFWVGSGPFYLECANTTQKIIHLKRFDDYPDPMDRWVFLLEPLPQR